MRIRYIFCAVVLLLGWSDHPAFAASGIDHMVIAAVQTGQPGKAGNDFVEVYNPTDAAVDVTGWKLQYRSATGVGESGWATKRTIVCLDVVSGCAVVVPPGGRLLLSTYAIDGQTTQPLISGFSDTGGEIRIIHDATDVLQPPVVEDMLGYGTAAEAEGQPAVAPPSGQVLLRKVDATGVVDTDNNANDFAPGCYEPLPADPLAAQPPMAIACPDPEPVSPVSEGTAPSPDSPSPSGEQPVATTTYLPLRITELLPDPASPQTDVADEFIELFNPNSQAVDASGYTLAAGTDFRYTFVLDGVAIAPGDYVIVTSGESHISLSNSGTEVELRDPNGAVVDHVASYGAAKTGEAWALGQNGWQWTALPTPGAANQFPALPAALTTAATTKKASTSTKKAAATTTKATAKMASSTTPKAAKTTAPPQAPQSADGSGFNYALLVPIGAITLGYAGYEYRQEIAKLGRRLWRGIARQKDDDITLQTD